MQGAPISDFRDFLTEFVPFDWNRQRNSSEVIGSRNSFGSKAQNGEDSWRASLAFAKSWRRAGPRRGRNVPLVIR